MRCILWACLVSGCVLPTAAADSDPGRYFRIQVVDEQTGRGVPLVELRTVNNISFWTDSNGLVAFHEPGLMNQRVFFFVTSHGYEFPADGFGMRGRALEVRPGGSAVLKIKRINIAERIYRITGGGIYRDTVLLGEPAPIAEPVLNAKVFGQDSVLTVVYRGRLFWFWGDTGWPAYPLGNFHMSGATSRLPRDGGLDPERGVNLEYFADEKGFSKPMAPLPGEGPTWCDSFVVLPDASGRQRLYGQYAKIRPDGSMATYERGMIVYNDEKAKFEKVVEFPLDAPVYPGRHVIRDPADAAYLYCISPYPLTRVRATVSDLLDLSSYEGYTCLVQGSRIEDARIDRDADGRVRYGWKKNTPPIGPKEQAQLIKDGRLAPHEGAWHLQDPDTGKSVMAASGTIAWNPYRNRWIMITGEIYGTSVLGEVWYAEADSMLGPWVYARKVVTHDRYSFYHPKHHVEFDKEGGRVIFFEGTYTELFSGAPSKTPRYDYNQIMYKLDLADRRLALPAPMMAPREAGGLPEFVPAAPAVGPPAARDEIGFFAMDRAGPGTIPVYAREVRGGRRLVAGREGDASGETREPVFFALPADLAEPPATTAVLYESVTSDGGATYSVDPPATAQGAKRPGSPICRVWRNPMRPAPASKPSDKNGAEAASPK
jgi:hypothetical protein